MENQLEESLISQRRVFDSIRNTDVSKFDVTQKMIRIVRSSARCYKEAQAKKREHLSEEEKKVVAKKRVAQELAIKEREKKRLKAAMLDAIGQLDSEIAELRKQT